MNIRNADCNDIDPSMSDFDRYICKDMEFTGDCIRQDRLNVVGKNFSCVRVSEVICLREHACCRSRLVLSMVQNNQALNDEEAARKIVTCFINPAGGEDSFSFYVAKTLSKKNLYPTWFLEKKCIPEKVFELFDEHMLYPADNLLSQGEANAVIRHVEWCYSCKCELRTMPGVALSLL